MRVLASLHELNPECPIADHLWRLEILQATVFHRMPRELKRTTVMGLATVPPRLSYLSLGLCSRCAEKCWCRVQRVKCVCKGVKANGHRPKAKKKNTHPHTYLLLHIRPPFFFFLFLFFSAPARPTPQPISRAAARRLKRVEQPTHDVGVRHQPHSIIKGTRHLAVVHSLHLNRCEGDCCCCCCVLSFFESNS